MAEPNRSRWSSLATYLFALLFAGVGLAAWSFFVYQIYDSVLASSSVGHHDEGSNNLGPGIRLAIFGGLALIASLLAFIGCLVTKNYTREPDDQRILRFAAYLNGSLLACAALVAFYFRLFRGV